MDTLKKYFSQSHFSSIQDIVDEQRNQDINQAIFLSNVFIVALMVGILILGFVAVRHICPDPSERGKNTRLGLYFLLLVTGGQIGWLYILLWLANINLCL
jgi:hypothetical protein